MTKKGIVLNFLTSVIIALMLFIPAIYVVSKILHFNEQGGDSFEDFTKKLENFAKDEAKPRAGMVLIMEEESAVLVYNAKDNLPFREISFSEQYSPAGSFQQREEYFLPYPEGLCGEVPCACLCQNFIPTEKEPVYEDISHDGRKISLRQKEYACTKLRCQALEEVRLQDSWSIYRAEGEPKRMVVNFVKEIKGVKIVK